MSCCGPLRALTRQPTVGDSFSCLHGVQLTHEPDGALTATSLSALFSLTGYNRLLYLSAPGLLLNSKPLERLFSKRSDSPAAGLPDDAQRSPQTPTSALLIQPSKDEHTRIVDAHASRSTLSATALLRTQYPAFDKLFSAQPALDAVAGEGDDAPYAFRTADLRAASGLANATTLLAAAGYARLSDDGLPGPEYDIPSSRWARAAPHGAEAHKAWESLYTRFRDRRMEVCGLDLEPWPEAWP